MIILFAVVFACIHSTTADPELEPKQVTRLIDKNLPCYRKFLDVFDDDEIRTIMRSLAGFRKFHSFDDLTWYTIDQMLHHPSLVLILQRFYVMMREKEDKLSPQALELVNEVKQAYEDMDDDTDKHPEKNILRKILETIGAVYYKGSRPVRKELEGITHFECVLHAMAKFT